MISILMPVFNTAAYLPECLDSVLAQTERTWELLAVDDFSTDESAAILERYAQKDPRIRWMPNERKGMVPALNLAFPLTSGALVTRMDSDDRMLPGKLTALKNLLELHGTGHVATGQVAYFSEGGLGDGYRRYGDWLNGLTRSGNYWKEIYRECVISSPCWMAWRNDLFRCGAFIEEVYPEDYELCFLFRQAGFQILAATEPVHEWRDRPDRTTRTDERYRDNTWLDLKLRWFLHLDYDSDRPLVLWGAGKKGKRLAQLLEQQSIPFHWACNNAKKWGREIGNSVLNSTGEVFGLEQPQIIVAIASPGDQTEVAALLEANHWVAGKEYFFFC